MTEANSSQTHKNRADLLDPTAWVESWRKMTNETLSQVATWVEQTGNLQESSFGHWNEAVDERARFLHELLAHAARVSNPWRDLAVEATRCAADAVRS